MPPSPKATKRSRSGSAPKQQATASEERNFKGNVDPDMPLDVATGKVYHLACTRNDLADNFIFVGDPARVAIVASRFDKKSVIFEGSHREINIITGKYKGTPVTVLSTGMGTDNVEIIINEIHALREFDHKTRKWDPEMAAKANDVRIIRVGTSGSPHAKAAVGTIAITRHGIGMDNTCRYYDIPHTETTRRLEAIVNATELKNAGGVYATYAHADITAALVKSATALPSKRPHLVGTTASGSGFYGCQGRVVGRFRNRLTVPNLLTALGGIELPIKGATEPERVVNIEMENSAVCSLSNILGYRAGTVCAIIAKRVGSDVAFATPPEALAAITDAITCALDALIAA